MSGRAYTREEVSDLTIRNAERIRASAMSLMQAQNPQQRFVESALDSDEALASTDPLIIFRVDDFARLLREYTHDVIQHAAAATVGAVWNDNG